VLRERTVVLTRDRRDDVTRAVARESAQSATAPRETSQPSRAARRRTSAASSSPAFARRSSRNEPRKFFSTSSLASSTATSVSEATAARCRNSVASGDTGALASPSIRTLPIASSPDTIGTSASTPFGTAAERSRARSST